MLFSFFSFGILSHTFLPAPSPALPGWVVQAPPSGDITDTVSIIGVVLIEIASPNYDGSNGLEKAAR